MEELIKSVPLFSSLPEGEVRDIAGSMRTRRSRAGDLLVKENEHCDSLYYLLERLPEKRAQGLAWLSRMYWKPYHRLTGTQDGGEK